MSVPVPKIDIRPDHWAIVQAILHKHVPEREVWAFGSRAQWTAKEHSDLDLAILGEQPLGLALSAALADDFSESDLPWKVDVVDWATTSESFRKIIERDKVGLATGQSPEILRQVRIEDIAKKIAIGPFGSRMKANCYVDSGVPVIRGTNLTGGRRFSGEWVFVSEKTAADLSGCLVKAGDLVFPHRGAIGEVGIVPEGDGQYMLSSSLMKIECDRSQVEPLYLFYFFKSDKGRHELLKNASQVGTPGIGQPLSSLRSISLSLPRLDYQKAAARILGTLDDKIELNRRINQTLEAMAQALFRSWFVDFDPVKAKIAALAHSQDPQTAAMRAISGLTDAQLDALPTEQHQALAATAALFPNELDESADPVIPLGWSIRLADDVSEVGIGKTPPRKEPQWFTEGEEVGEDDVPWVSIRDMGNRGIFQQKTAEFLTAEAVGRFNVRVVPDHTVLLSFKLTVGRVAITEGDMVTNEAIAHFKLLDGALITTEYLYLLLKAFDYSTLGSTSSIADAVNSKTIRELPVLVPKLEVMRQFSNWVQPLFREIKLLQSEIVSLEQTRDALLPKLLSGDIEVPV